MASVTSSISNNVTTYVITDERSNTLTIVAQPTQSGGGTTFTSSGGLLYDGQQILATLMPMLQVGLRPNVIPGTNASFSN